MTKCRNCGLRFNAEESGHGKLDCSPDCYIERRTTKSDPADCWRWGNANNHYGTATFDGTAMPAHRFVYIHAFGPIADDLHVMHDCDVKHCCNPNHLEAGTPSKNQRDAYLRGLKQRYTRNPSRTITDDTAVSIYLDTGWAYEIAQRYKVSVHTVRRIRSGKHYRPATAQLPPPTTSRWAEPRADRRGRSKH